MRQMLLRQFRQNKSINRIPHPKRIHPRHFRQRRPNYWLQTPPVVPIHHLDLVRLRRPLRPLIDPRPNHPHLLRRKRIPLRRHHNFRINPSHIMNQPTMSRIPRQNRLANVAALKRICPSIQPIIRLLLLRAVTTVTALGKDRLNLLDKINRVIRRRWEFR